MHSRKPTADAFHPSSFFPFSFGNVVLTFHVDSEIFGTSSEDSIRPGSSPLKRPLILLLVQQRSLGVFRRHNLRLCNLPSSYDTHDFVASRFPTAFPAESPASFDLQCSRCLKHSAIANDRLRDCPAAAVHSFNWQIERQRSVQMPCVELAVSFLFDLRLAFFLCHL